MTPEEVAALPIPEQPPVPKITRHQCTLALFSRQMITGEEAKAMAAWAEPPEMVERVLAAIPEPDQTTARINFAADTYERTNPLLNHVMTAAGSTSEQIDEFFREAAKL